MPWYSIQFPCMKKKVIMYVIEDERKGKAQKADTYRNQKRHMPSVSLLLWHEMVAMCCFVWGGGGGGGWGQPPSDPPMHHGLTFVLPFLFADSALQ